MDAVCYSFNGNKTITSGGGGAVASADARLIERINHLVTTARVGTAYEHDEVGYNFRMTNVEAAIGVASLSSSRVSSTGAGRSNDTSPLPPPTISAASQPRPRVVVCTAIRAALSRTDAGVCEAFRAMNADGVDVRLFWKPIHLQRPYEHAVRTPMPVTEALERIVLLPSSTGITDDELYVADLRLLLGDDPHHGWSFRSPLRPSAGPTSRSFGRCATVCTRPWTSTSASGSAAHISKRRAGEPSPTSKPLESPR